MTFQYRSVMEQVEDKFLIGDGCWPWTAAKSDNGYGRVGRGSTTTLLAHRIVYELLIGPIPAGLELDHLCRRRDCVRPDHLEPVTHRVNVQRGPKDGYGWRGRLTECGRGHPYDAANTRHRRDGSRVCRTCHRATQARYRKAQTIVRDLPRAVRRAVMERDGYRCRSCGTDHDLSIDHINPRSAGGGHQLENLQTLCRACNSAKGARV